MSRLTTNEIEEQILDSTPHETEKERREDMDHAKWEASMMESFSDDSANETETSRVHIIRERTDEWLYGWECHEMMDPLVEELYEIKDEVRHTIEHCVATLLLGREVYQSWLDFVGERYGEVFLLMEKKRLKEIHMFGKYYGEKDYED